MPTKTTIDYGYDFDAEDRKKNEMVQRILEDKLRGASRFLVQKLNMGDAPSYIAAVTFRWIAQNLLLFTQLNLFKKPRRRGIRPRPTTTCSELAETGHDDNLSIPSAPSKVPTSARRGAGEVG
jgi:hypothetical protein